MSSSNQSGKKKWEDGLQEQNRQFDTQEIQELFQEINLERPPKRRKLLRDILLEPASETEGLNSGHSLPCKRAREGPNIESSSISASHLVPIGVVGFDPLSSHPTILFCDAPANKRVASSSNTPSKRQKQAAFRDTRNNLEGARASTHQQLKFFDTCSSSDEDENDEEFISFMGPCPSQAEVIAIMKSGPIVTEAHVTGTLHSHLLDVHLDLPNHVTQEFGWSVSIAHPDSECDSD
jgi:hypothetical protein